jgi:uncharacterized protein involved in type VI secretion and phage assembly
MSGISFYGKYRGVVTDNQDPLRIGRICATVPDVMGEDPSGWAWPCAPFGGKDQGFFALPAVGAGVWIEFEQGNADYPIWSGCWWSSPASMPAELAVEPEKKVLIKTGGGHSILLDDSVPAKITIQTTGGQKIILSDEVGGQITIQTAPGQRIILQTADIQIDNAADASIGLTGPSVVLNKDALEVI